MADDWLIDVGERAKVSASSRGVGGKQSEENCLNWNRELVANQSQGCYCSSVDVDARIETIRAIC